MIPAEVSLRDEMRQRCHVGVGFLDNVFTKAPSVSCHTVCSMTASSTGTGWSWSPCCWSWSSSLCCSISGAKHLRNDFTFPMSHRIATGKKSRTEVRNTANGHGNENHMTSTTSHITGTTVSPALKEAQNANCSNPAFLEITDSALHQFP